MSGYRQIATKWGIPILIIVLAIVASFLSFSGDPVAKARRNNYARLNTPTFSDHELDAWAGTEESKSYNSNSIPGESSPTPGTAGASQVPGQTTSTVVAGTQSSGSDSGVSPLNTSAAGIPVPSPSSVLVFTCRGRAHGVGLCMDGVRYRAQSGQSAIQIINYYYTGVEISKVDDSRPIRVKGRDGQIRTLSMHDYLCHLAEEPEDYPAEGLKVLYMAARTYTLNCIARGKHTSAGFDICSSGECCQAFDENKDISKSPNNVAAVNATDGQIITFGGAPITAAYCGSCGGHTENNEDVWGGAAIPYLRGKPDSFCSQSPRFSTTVEITASELGSKLGVGSVTLLNLSNRTPGGRVKTAAVTGSSGSKSVPGSTLEKALGFRNTLFDYTIK
jgi:SpoIID/LytB domain protein